MEDFNSKRNEWNCSTENYIGSKLLDFCLQNNVVISYPQSFTNFPTKGNPSVLDLFLIKGNLPHNLPQSLDELCSDHNPVFLSVNFSYDKTNQKKVFDFTRADWNYFRDLLNRDIDLKFHINTKDKVEYHVKSFVNSINKSAEKSIPRIKPTKNLFVLPRLIGALIRCKNRLRKTKQNFSTQHNKDRYKVMQKLVNSKISKYVNDKIKNDLVNLKCSDGSLWKKTKKFTKKMSDIPTIQNESGQFLNTDREKANGFASYFSTLSTENKELGKKYFSDKVKRTVNQTVNHQIDMNEIKFASIKEVRKAIKSLKNKKAAGSDGISAKLIKNLPQKAIVYLVKIINGVFVTGHYPSEWKVAKVVPIHKKKQRYLPSFEL